MRPIKKPIQLIELSWTTSGSKKCLTSVLVIFCKLLELNELVALWHLAISLVALKGVDEITFVACLVAYLGVSNS